MLELTEKNFKDTITSTGLILVDFNADWCGPCQMQAPILEEIVAETDFTLASLNVDDAPDVARNFAVSSIPCLIIFKNGEEKKRLIGLQPKKSILKHLEKLSQ